MLTTQHGTTHRRYHLQDLWRNHHPLPPPRTTTTLTPNTTTPHPNRHHPQDLWRNNTRNDRCAGGGYIWLRFGRGSNGYLSMTQVRAAERWALWCVLAARLAVTADMCAFDRAPVCACVCHEHTQRARPGQYTSTPPTPTPQHPHPHASTYPRRA